MFDGVRLFKDNIPITDITNGEITWISLVGPTAELGAYRLLANTL